MKRTATVSKSYNNRERFSRNMCTHSRLHYTFESIVGCGYDRFDSSPAF